MSKLVELNGFIQAANGVFHVPQTYHEFAYTDGADTEQKLEQILRQADDLSSSSSELLAHVDDWPSEYHLSSTRANLLRALDLNGVSRVLELGCGCGSISRYLGEQTEMHVDAIEGSPSRAALAALRCRDQSNVVVSTANFNDIQLPENYYDLILFVGVTEYAGRFSSSKTDQAALQGLLSMAKSASSDTGVTLIAIENRLGLKYLLGAKEDHYAVPFVGLDNYPDSSGIRTYSKVEWQKEIASAGFTNSRFLYPFPDYKIPTMIVTDAIANNLESNNLESNNLEPSDSEGNVSGDVAGHNKPAILSEFYTALEHFSSRDYNSNFSCQNEAVMWRALHQAGTFDQHSNSFLMLLSDSLETLDKMSDFQYKSYQAPEFDYLKSELRRPSSVTAPVSDALNGGTQINSSDAEIIDLQNQLTTMHNELALLKGSKGWRLLNLVRRLLGNKPI